MTEITSTPETPEPVQQTARKKTAKYWIIGSIVVLFLIAGVAGVSFARKFKHFHDDGPLGFMLGKITEDLDLNAQQKTEVQKIKDEIKAKMESKKQNHQDRAAEFENLFKSDNLDRKALSDLNQKREADRQEMSEFFMDELIKFHDILTSSQRVKAVEKMKEMREKFEKGGFKHHKGDGPPKDNN
jgi:Spy/CpxP family protein refolding chaperone